jgi:hypothetical protein
MVFGGKQDSPSVRAAMSKGGGKLATYPGISGCAYESRLKGCTLSENDAKRVADAPGA